MHRLTFDQKAELVVATAVPIVNFKFASTLEADVGWGAQQGDAIYNTDKQHFITE
jgi:hypothetical protein